MNEALTHARSTDLQTSKDAANLAMPIAAVVKQRVFEIFCDFPDGLTDEELSYLYAWAAKEMEWKPRKYDTPRKRRCDLTAEGRLVPTGERRLGSTVWQVNF